MATLYAIGRRSDRPRKSCQAIHACVRGKHIPCRNGGYLTHVNLSVRHYGTRGISDETHGFDLEQGCLAPSNCRCRTRRTAPPQLDSRACSPASWCSRLAPACVQVQSSSSASSYDLQDWAGLGLDVDEHRDHNADVWKRDAEAGRWTCARVVVLARVQRPTTQCARVTRHRVIAGCLVVKP